MIEFYERMRCHPWNTDYITRAHAERLLADADTAARSDPRAAPKGSPLDEAEGIHFLAHIVPGLGGMRVRLWARTRGQVPAADLERLERETAAHD